MAEVWIGKIFIYDAYEGYMAGWPKPSDCVEEALKEVKKLGWDVREPVILPPEETDCEASQAGRQAKLIPRFVHIADLQGMGRGANEDGTSMVAVWFADAPSLDLEPILPKLDWENRAHGWEF